MAGQAGNGGDRRAPKARARRADPRRDELLSAYLDGQLSEAARARLEQRLAADAELQAELGALRCTVALVRELPPVTPPRHFTLSPAAVERGERVRRSPRTEPGRLSRATPWLTAATAAVATMLAVVLAGHVLLAGPSLAPAALAPAAPPEQRMPVEVTQEPLLMAAEEAPAETEAPAAERAFDLAPEATAVPPAAPTEAPVAAAESMAVPENGTPAAAAPKAALTEAPALAALPTPAEEAPVEEFQALEVPPAAPEAATGGQADEGAPQAQLLVPQEEQMPVAGGVRRGVAPAGLWLALEAVLAVSLVVLAVLTVLAWSRRGQHAQHRRR